MKIIIKEDRKINVVPNQVDFGCSIRCIAKLQNLPTYPRSIFVFHRAAVATVRSLETTLETARRVEGGWFGARRIGRRRGSRNSKRSGRWRRVKDGRTANRKNRSSRSRNGTRPHLRRWDRGNRLATADRLRGAIGRTDGMAGDRRSRRPAEEQFRIKTPSRETAAKSEEARAAEAAKTTRLRALRLAKEAADRDAQKRARPRPA